jgi:hypothetical protein
MGKSLMGDSNIDDTITNSTKYNMSFHPLKQQNNRLRLQQNKLVEIANQ